MSGMSEAEWEALALDVLGELAWTTVDGKRTGPGSGERESWAELIIPGRLRAAIARFNPDLPAAAVEEAAQLVLTPKSRDAKGENRQVHRYLTEGIRSVVYTDEHGAEHNPTIRLIDYAEPYANDFLAANQENLVFDRFGRQRSLPEHWTLHFLRSQIVISKRQDQC